MRNPIQRILFLAFSLIIFLPSYSESSGVVNLRQQQAQQAQQRAGQQRQAANQRQANPYGAGQPSGWGRDAFVTPEEEYESIDLKQVWAELEISSEIWPLIMDPEPKEVTVKRYIQWYQNRGVHISKPPAYYVGVIDSMIQGNPAILHNPFKDILRVVAITEYDFNNGQNPDTLARQVLGEEAYQSNRARLGMGQ